MDTLLPLPALNSAEETARFVDQVLTSAVPLRAQMQVADAEIARLAAETRDLCAESVRLRARQEQAAHDMDAALAILARRATQG